MQYIEYIEQHEYESGIKEVASLKEAESFILGVYTDNQELTDQYIDEYGLRPEEDMQMATDVQDNEVYVDTIKRLFTNAGYYVNVKEEQKDAELDRF